MSQRRFILIVCALMTLSCLTSAWALWTARRATRDAHILLEAVKEDENSRQQVLARTDAALAETEAGRKALDFLIEQTTALAHTVTRRAQPVNPAPSQAPASNEYWVPGMIPVSAKQKAMQSAWDDYLQSRKYIPGVTLSPREH